MTVTLEAPAVDIAVNEDTVRAISVRLHDQKCALKDRCYNRDWHALDSFERTARNFLTIAADARRAGEI